MKRYNWEYNGDTMGLIERADGICVLYSDVKDCLDRKSAFGLLEELEAILLLEYHNKNHLHFGVNPKRLNEEKREIIKRIKVSLPTP